MADRSEPMSAGPSEVTRHANPQLGPEPWFAYPDPTYEELEQELPPYFEHENVSLGVILDRMTTKGYADLRGLLEEALPSSPIQHRPRLIIDFAKAQRQSFLKYLAILRWKSTVDVPAPATLPEASSSNSTIQQIHSIPTPITNGSYGGSTDNSPAAGYIGKGKGRAMTSEDEDKEKLAISRGRVTDAKRVQVLMEHQNRQHEMALHHISAALGQVESLRERNPDLLTAISVLQTGTYTRLPTSVTTAFKPVKRLTNRAILRILRRLNRHLLFRLRCVDHLPPELIVEAVRDGKVHFGAGGESGWKAHMTVVGFGKGDDARWWLTGVEWGWKAKGKGTDNPGGAVRGVSEDERTQILEIVNNQVLSPRPVNEVDTDEKEGGKMDAPLIRLYNFLQHLSLSYQLETLFTQAMEMTQGRWRGQLLVDLDRQAKSLRVRYWIRQRPTQQPQQPGPGQKRSAPSSVGGARTPLVGGTLRISLSEAAASEAGIEDLIRGLMSGDSEPPERVVKLELGVKWEVGEGGVGGGLRVGDAMDTSSLELNPACLSFASILQAATTIHAAHLTRAFTAPLLSSPRIALFPLNLPSILERDSTVTPLSLQIPLPSRQKSSALVVSVSALTGLIEIEDEGATDSRIARARLASAGINEQKANLLNDLGRLITAVIAETLESQMRQLGWSPTRRLALKSQDLAKNDLHPASSIFVPLPTSNMHYFMAKVGQQGITFELVKLVRVTADNGVGTKLSVGDRTPMDLMRMRSRRAERKEIAKGGEIQAVEPIVTASNFEINRRDMKDLFIFCNALVAQTIVEQQLKDRSIPHTLQYPPPTGPGAARSTSAVAGMIPTICVNVHDLLKDRRASDTAQPKVYIQLKDWWKGEKCKAVTVVQLRHKPTLSSSSETATGNAGALAGAAKDEGISFDQASSVVRFETDDITRCVPSFLEQWERLSKVIVVAGEVNRLNKSESFKDMRMISFDLRTATFTYAPGYTASITYTPQDDSYRIIFDAEGVSPHGAMAALLSHRLNEMTGGPKSSVKRSTGEQFLGLLCNTLPFLQEVEAVRSSSGEFPVLVISSVSDFRLVWDVQNAHRYIVNVTLVCDKYLIRDGSTLPDQSCGPLTAISNWVEMLDKAYTALKQSNQAQAASSGKGAPIILDKGRSLICGVENVREVVRVVAEGVAAGLGL